MCESNAYLIKHGKEELLMENVGFMRLLGDKVFLRSIFGEETTVEAQLRELNLMSHRIELEQP